MTAQIYDIAGVRLLLDERAGKEISTIISKMSQPLDLRAIVEADANGLICWFAPQSGMEWDFIFFIQNLMINQRMFLIDEFARKQGLIQ